MKKKLLLLVIPTLMVLSGCSNVFAEPIVEKAPEISMVEDTEAHEEIFGGSGEFKQLGIRKAGNPENIDDVKLAVQTKYDSGTDKMSIRFVAAVRYTNVSAVWHRGFARGNGTVQSGKGFNTEPLTASKYYLSINDNGNIITAGTTAGYENYEGFVVYTLNDIPYDSNKDCYLASYLTLTDLADPTNNYSTQVRAAKIEQNFYDHDSDDATPMIPTGIPQYYFDFPTNTNGYFLAGVVASETGAGVDGIVLGANKTEEQDASNVAVYSNLVLAKDDYFGSFFFNGSEFMYFGYLNMFDNIYGYLDEERSVPGFATPFIAGTYTLYVSRTSYGHMYINVESWSLDGHYPLYLKPNMWKTDTPVARFAVQAYKSSPAAEKWYDLTDSDGDGVYCIEGENDFNPNTYERLIFCRMDGAKAANNWDNKWNQTQDMWVSSLNNGPFLVCNITDWGTGAFAGYFSVR